MKQYMYICVYIYTYVGRYIPSPGNNARVEVIDLY